MMGQAGKCPDCGQPQSQIEVLGARFATPCPKCRVRRDKAYLEKQNQERLSRLRQEYRGIVPPLYRATDPAHPAINQELLKELLEFDPARGGGKGIGLHGPTGGAKTRMMYLLVGQLHFGGAKVRCVQAIELAQAHAQTFDDDLITRGRARSLIESATRADVLFLDDLGKERFTETVEAGLYKLIEKRAANLKPILWTSNLNSNDLRAAMSDNRGAPVIRRLAEFSRVFFVRSRHAQSFEAEQKARSA